MKNCFSLFRYVCLAAVVLGAFWLVQGCQPEVTPGEKAKEVVSDAAPVDQGPADTSLEIKATPGTSVTFNTEGKWDSEKTFFNFPFPSDLRLTEAGGPDFKGFPNPEGNRVVTNVLEHVSDRKGFPVIPVAYFRTSEALAKREHKAPIKGTKDAPVMLIDIDAKSPDRGKLYPVAAGSLNAGNYVTGHILAVAVYPGIVLHPNRTYAFVLMRSYNDANGKPLGVSKEFNVLKAGFAPTGAMGEKLKTLYDPLWETLKTADVKLEDVAGATVFTTGDVVAETHRVSEALRKKHTADIKGLKLDPDDGDHTRYCELHGTITQPQFQKGTPPFNSDGRFVLDKDGVPEKQRDKELPVVITIPKKEMPKEGYPLLIYIHGSGGLSGQAVDRGTQTKPGGAKKKGEGPSHVVAPFNIATASSAMPVNPERLKNANAFSYLNLTNPSAFRDTFRQGVIETRILLDALLRLKIDKSELGSCTGPTLPAGVDKFFFSAKRPALMGQSMGAMYTNMIGAVESRFKAVVPTGAGGYWSFFALHSNVTILNETLLRRLIEAEETLTFTHPVMQLFQTAWEDADPLVYVPRLSHRPLPGHAPKHIYQPIGQSDSYFPEVVIDILTLGYNNQQAGNEVWKETQERLAIAKNDGLVKYPVELNRQVPGGKETYTGIAVQYKPDDVSKDGHVIAFQLDDVKFQYTCFLDSYFRTGVGTVPAPKALGSPCK